MSFADIIDEVDRLEPIERQRLMSHLVVLRLKENQSFRKEMASRFADKSPEQWVSLEEAKRMFPDGDNV
ncbi:MAG: hypothetical protein ACQKBV_04480 [Puniceicoccales bacterium]